MDADTKPTSVADATSTTPDKSMETAETLHPLVPRDDVSVEAMRDRLKKLSSNNQRPIDPVRPVHVVLESPNILWLHKASQCIADHLKKDAKVDLAIKQPSQKDFSKAPAFGSSIFHNIPRTPASFLRRFCTLELHDVHFRVSSHFVKLVSELSNLESLCVGGLTFADVDDCQWLWPAGLRDVTVCDRVSDTSGDGGLLSTVLSASMTFGTPCLDKKGHGKVHKKKRGAKQAQEEQAQHAQNPSLSLRTHPRQHAHFHGIMHVFYSLSANDERDIEWEILRAHAGPETARVAVTGLQIFAGAEKQVTPTMSFDLAGRPNREEAIEREHQKKPQQLLYATRVQITLGALQLTREDLQMYDWVSFFACLGRFEYLEEVVLAFGCGDGCSEFVGELNEILGQCRGDDPGRHSYDVRYEALVEE